MVARCFLISISLITLSGCAPRLFEKSHFEFSSGDYDSQGCVEDALRRHPDTALTAAAASGSCSAEWTVVVTRTVNRTTPAPLASSRADWSLLMPSISFRAALVAPSRRKRVSLRSRSTIRAAEAGSCGR